MEVVSATKRAKKYYHAFLGWDNTPFYGLIIPKFCPQMQYNIPYLGLLYCIIFVMLHPKNKIDTHAGECQLVHLQKFCCCYDFRICNTGFEEIFIAS